MKKQTAKRKVKPPIKAAKAKAAPKVLAAPVVAAPTPAASQSGESQPGESQQHAPWAADAECQAKDLGHSGCRCATCEEYRRCP